LKELCGAGVSCQIKKIQKEIQPFTHLWSDEDFFLRFMKINL